MAEAARPANCLPAPPPDAYDLQECFSLPPLVVVCLVRHIDRALAEVATPPCVERCVVELQSYFQSCVDAGRVVDRAAPGSKLHLQFGKAVDVGAGAGSSLLSVYIVAVDQPYSRPRLLSHVAKKWRTHLEETGQEGSSFVMLYHHDLVSAAVFSANQASGGSGESSHVGEPNQMKAEAAVATLELYFEELKALRFAPHQMCAYLPNEAPVRILERLRVAFAERTAKLRTSFESYQVRQSHHACTDSNINSNSNSNNNSNESNMGMVGKGWNLKECWRRGYDLAMHLLQFGVVTEAKAVFARMFSLYYYHSEDYDFVKGKTKLAQLGKLPNVFDPKVYQVGKNGYPSVFLDDAEFIEALLFITACEMRCALQLGLRDAAFGRYRAFLQVAREKFAEDAANKKTTRDDYDDSGWENFFLLRCTVSAMRLNWSLGEETASGSESLMSPGPRMNTVKEKQHHQQQQQQEEETKYHPLDGLVTSPDFSDVLSLSVMDEWNVSAAPHNFNRSVLFSPPPDEEDEMKMSRGSMARQLRTLCDALHVNWHSESDWMYRLLSKLSTDALDFLMDLSAVLGYTETGEVVTRAIPKCSRHSSFTSSSSPPTASDFEMPEIASAAVFVSFYRALTEAAAICFSLLGDRRIAHALYYKFALSHRVDNPLLTAELCQQRLIPFCRHHGWLQLQTIVHRLFVESMDVVMQQREARGQPPLEEDEEAVMLKESILYIIGALSEEGPLQEEIHLLCGRKPVATWWCHLARIDDKWKSLKKSNETPSYSLSLVLKNPHVFCMHSDTYLSSSSSLPAEPLREERVGSREGSLTEKDVRVVGTPSFLGLHANISGTVLISFSATSLVDIFSLEMDEEGTSRIMVTATLASKKDWADSIEPIHIVDVDKIVSSSYDEAKKSLQWVWEFQPSRAGEYHLLCITLRVAMTTLVYIHNESAGLSGGGPISFHVNDFSRGVELMPRCLFFVPEPDTGIKLNVLPPDEPHCFGDTMNYFTVYVEVERSLYSQHGIVTNSTTTTTTTATTLTGGSSVGTTTITKRDVMHSKSCFDGSIALGPVATSISTAIRSSSHWDGCNTFMTGTMQAPNANTLALIYVYRPRRYAPQRSTPFSASMTSLLPRSVKDGPLWYDMSTSRRIDLDHSDNSFGNLNVNSVQVMISISDEKTGSFTTVPVNEQFVMSQLPPLLRSNEGKNNSDDNGNSGSGEGGGERVASMHLEGSILMSPRQQCCFKISLDDNGPEKEEDKEVEVGVENEQRGINKYFGDLLETTSLKSSLPVLPFLMSSTDECAHVSLYCHRNMELCTTSVSVPLRFKQAFAVQYFFKCFQSRVYCLVHVENVLQKTSLWLRGALLELLDTECYYRLTRISATHEHMMLREWKPHDKMHLFFELSPSSEPSSNEKEVCHRVRLQLMYSNWSLASEMKPLEAHILCPSSVPSAPSSTALTPEATSSSITLLACGENGLEKSADTQIMDSTRETSKGGSALDRSMHSVRQPVVTYNPLQLEKLRTTCNTFNGPVGTFTSKHSCLFNVMLFVDPMHLRHSVNHLGMSASPPAARRIGLLHRYNIENTSDDFLDSPPLPIGVSAVDLSGDCVFPVGEPIRFSVALEPLAHNWSDDSDGEEEFMIAFKADPSAWMITGKQRIRRVLSMMQDETMYFTAVPVPAVPSPSAEREEDQSFERDVDMLLQEQQQHAENNRRKQKVSVVPTPTVEIYWAPRGGDVGWEETAAADNVVPIDVVQFRTCMRVRH